MKKGFSFVEVLVCVVIVAIVTSALMGLVVQNLAAAQLTRDRFIAANLAQEGIEIIVNFRSNNWLAYPSTFNSDGSLTNWRGTACSDGNANYCLLMSVSPSDFVASYNSQRLYPATASNITLRRDATGRYCNDAIDGCNSGTPSPFTRRITLQNVSGHQFKVVSTVSWIYNNHAHSVRAEDRLYNWR